MLELVVILVLIAFDLGCSMMAHSLYVKVNFWYRLMFWACFTFLLYKAGLFGVLMKQAYGRDKRDSLYINRR